MKLIDQKGKLFGKINIIDLIIIVCVVVVAAALAYKFVAPAAESVVAPKSDMYVTMRVRGGMDYLDKEVNDHLKPGTKLIAGSDYIAGAEVVDVWSDDYLAAVPKDDGTVATASDPQKRDIFIKVKAKQNKNDPILKIGNQEIRIGRGFIFKTQTIEVNAIIETVEFNG